MRFFFFKKKGISLLSPHLLYPSFSDINFSLSLWPGTESVIFSRRLLPLASLGPYFFHQIEFNKGSKNDDIQNSPPGGGGGG